MIFINSKGVGGNIVHNCITESAEPIPSRAHSRYCLEVNAGLSKQLDNKIGDNVTAEKIINEAADLPNACDLGQALADRYMMPVFIHSFPRSKDGKQSGRKYAALLKKHYDNDETRYYGYHLEKI